MLGVRSERAAVIVTRRVLCGTHRHKTLSSAHKDVHFSIRPVDKKAMSAVVTGACTTAPFDCAVT